MDQYLLTFVTVIEKESFTKAAEELYVTQSAVSLKIKELERRYGVKLFNRTNKYVRLTKAGEILYTHAKEILSQYDKSKRLIDDLFFSATGPLIIGSSYTFGEFALPNLIVKFLEKYPKIVPSISIRNSARIAEQVQRQEIDIGILEGKIIDPELTIKAFAQDEMVIIMPADHHLATKKNVTKKDLEVETWILREKGSSTREMSDQFLKAKSISPQTVLEFGSSQIVKEAVQRGLGISIMSKWLISNKVSHGMLSTLEIQGFSTKRDIYYVTNDARLRTKATDLFIDFMCESKLGEGI